MDCKSNQGGWANHGEREPDTFRGNKRATLWSLVDNHSHSGFCSWKGNHWNCTRLDQALSKIVMEDSKQGGQLSSSTGKHVKESSSEWERQWELWDKRYILMIESPWLWSLTKRARKFPGIFLFTYTTEGDEDTNTQFRDNCLDNGFEVENHGPVLDMLNRMPSRCCIHESDI